MSVWDTLHDYSIVLIQAIICLIANSKTGKSKEDCRLTYHTYGFTSLRKKTEILDNSPKIIDILPVFFEPKWSLSHTSQRGREHFQREKEKCTKNGQTYHILKAHTHTHTNKQKAVGHIATKRPTCHILKRQLEYHRSKPEGRNWYIDRCFGELQ